MIFMGVDIETTGLDPQKDCITEIGIVVMKKGQTKPLHMETFLVYEPCLKEAQVTEEITELTGITYNMLLMHGIDQEETSFRLKGAIEEYKVTHLVMHNGRNFDLPFIKAFSQRHDVQCFPEDFPLIDTREDLHEDLYAKARTEKLSYLAAHSGFLNPFPHSALFDVMTMMQLFFNDDVDSIVSRLKIPWIYVAASVDYNNRQLAKDRKYRWQEIGDLVFPRKWVKRIKQDMLQKEQQQAPFEVQVLQ